MKNSNSDQSGKEINDDKILPKVIPRDYKMIDVIKGGAGHEWKVIGHEHSESIKTGKCDVLVLHVETPCCGCRLRDTEEYLRQLTYCPYCGDDHEALSKHIYEEAMKAPNKNLIKINTFMNYSR